MYYLKNEAANKEKDNCIFSFKSSHKNREKFMEVKNYMEPIAAANFAITKLAWI